MKTSSVWHVPLFLHAFIRCWTRLWSILRTCRTILTFATKRSNFEVSQCMIIDIFHATLLLFYDIIKQIIQNGHIRDDFWYENTLWYPVDPVERNSVTMKQEVTTLQEILNRLDFKRKVSVSLHFVFYFLCSHFPFFLFVKGFVYLDCIVLFEPRWELPASDRWLWVVFTHI